MNYVENYEAHAEVFYHCHGYLAPGSDQPAVMGGRPRDLRDRWDAFRALCSPIDSACIVAVYRLRHYG